MILNFITYRAMDMDIYITSTLSNIACLNASHMNLNVKLHFGHFTYYLRMLQDGTTLEIPSIYTPKKSASSLSPTMRELQKNIMIV